MGFIIGAIYSLLMIWFMYIIADRLGTVLDWDTNFTAIVWLSFGLATFWPIGLPFTLAFFPAKK